MRAAAPTIRARQRGMALLLVLWAGTLLAILLGGYAVLARTQGLQARYRVAQTQAHYAAQAGLMRAIQALYDAPTRRWVADGRSYRVAFGQAQVEVSAVGENGKVDLNTAMPQVLQGLLRAAGLSPDAAQQLATHIVAWRQPPAASRVAGIAPLDYVAAGRDYRPRHGPFASIEELQLVWGMTPKLYARLASQVTIWSGRPVPNPNTAPPLALQAIPGLSAAQVQALLAARAGQSPDPTQNIDNGSTQSIKSVATLADGTKAQLRATIRWRASQTGAPPYAVLRWREGVDE